MLGVGATPGLLASLSAQHIATATCAGVEAMPDVENTLVIFEAWQNLICIFCSILYDFDTLKAFPWEFQETLILG